MDTAQKRPARIVLGLLIAVLGLALGLMSASGVGARTLGAVFATEAPAATPTPYTSCPISIPSPVPTPAPICKTVTPSPAPQPEPSSSPSPTKSPKKGPKAPIHTVTIDYRTKAARFVGEISANGKCEDLRRVIVLKVRDGKDERIGKAFTDASARYSLDVTKPAGRYYAKAPASVSIGYANQVDCERLKSQPVKV